MQPGGGGGGGGVGGDEHGCTEQHHTPATGCRRDEGTQSHSAPPFPAIIPVRSQKKQEQEPTASQLPEDAVIEILSRVPYKSLCRFKCVSKPWLALCSDPKIQSRSPKALAGFFYSDEDDGESPSKKDNPSDLHFHSLSGEGPPPVNPCLPFLRQSYKRFMVTQCCSSLLLCKCWKSYKRRRRGEYDYVVCNPMTEQWTVLPPIHLPEGVASDLLDLNQADRVLGFDTADLSSFVVFAPLTDLLERITQVAIYSSGTGRWVCVQSGWDPDTELAVGVAPVFLNGIMHFITDDLSVVTVDAEGKVWKKIQVPHGFDVSDPYASGSIGKSRGHLHAWRVDYDCQLSVWVLEDYGDGGKWTLKHAVNVLGLFGRHRQEAGESYEMFAIHPECNLVFLTDWKGMIVSYDMDSQEVQVICASGEFLCGLPYIPCSAKWSSDGH